MVIHAYVYTYICMSDLSTKPALILGLSLPLLLPLVLMLGLWLGDRLPLGLMLVLGLRVGEALGLGTAGCIVNDNNAKEKEGKNRVQNP